jgi:hypothetical protein
VAKNTLSQRLRACVPIPLTLKVRLNPLYRVPLKDDCAKIKYKISNWVLHKTAYLMGEPDVSSLRFEH